MNVKFHIGEGTSPQENVIDITGGDDYETEFISPNKILVRTKWISVKDRLPEDTDCIVYGTPFYGTCRGDPILTQAEPIVTQARYVNGRHRGFEFGEYDCGIEVTHWMPLPNPPEYKT